MGSKWKIGFIVEGDTDKRVIETLAKRLLGDEFQVQPVRLGSEIAMPWAYSTALTLLEEKHCQHVVLVFDSDSHRQRDVEQKQRQIEVSLKKHRLSEECSVCLAVPVIEAWLLASYEKDPEKQADPKEDLRQAMHTSRLKDRDVEQIAQKLDIAEARRRAPSLDSFAKLLDRVSNRLRKEAPAA